MKHLVTYPYYLLVCLTYFILSNQNANIDSWFYAACVKHREQLFQAHHLLYNYIGLGFYKICQVIHPSIEAIQSLFILNAIAATVSLVVFDRLLQALGTSKSASILLTLLCGTSFGFFRFATDAETYILPICFSLISTYFYIRSKGNRDTLLAAIFSVLAVLTHQVQIWWTLALLIHLFMDKQRQHKWLFLSILLLIPATYLGFYFQSKNDLSLLQFLGGEYAKGNAGLNVSLLSLALTFISFVRSFIQIHGYFIQLFEQYTVLLSCAGLVMIFLLIQSFRNFRFKWSLKNDSNKYSLLFLIAFIGQLIFASLSYGNAEFMVMLPFLLVLFAASRFEINQIKPVVYFSAFLFIWNLSLGIFPYHYLNFNATTIQQNWMLAHPEDNYYWKEKPLIENRMCYQEGFKKQFHYISKDSIGMILHRGESIITDQLESNKTLDRYHLTQTDNSNIFLGYNKVKLDSFENFYGKNYIYRVSKH